MKKRTPDYHKTSLRRRFGQSWCPEPFSGCWLWMAGTSLAGYGQISSSEATRRKEVYAHRLSWEIHCGPIPEKLFVLHSCDTPLCVNPDHLFLGTHRDNMQDALRKGRLKLDHLKQWHTGRANQFVHFLKPNNNQRLACGPLVSDGRRRSTMNNADVTCVRCRAHWTFLLSTQSK